jgi:hypothetical protein
MWKIEAKRLGRDSVAGQVLRERVKSGNRSSGLGDHVR